MNKKEIEITVLVRDPNALIEFLEKNTTLKKEKHQVDRYYTPAHRNFIEEKPVREWLRLRQEGESCSLNYKNWHYEPDGKSFYCDEFETKVADLSTVQNIFAAINFIPLVTVSKVRKTYEYNDYEIAFDAVEQLGNFIEIEYIGNQEVEPKQVANDMIIFLKNHGCEIIEQDFDGYPYRLLKKYQQIAEK